MNKLLSLTLVLMMVFLGTSAYALGTNITIYDGKWDYFGSDWHNKGEDQEVEPYSAPGQEWDLEGFFLDGDILSVVGGYDFINGKKDRYGRDTFLGDIFIDVDGDAVYGEAASAITGDAKKFNNYGYDYVIDLNLNNNYDSIKTNDLDVNDDLLSYNIYAIDNTSTVDPGFRNSTNFSNPWAFTRSNEESLFSGTMTHETFEGSYMGFEGSVEDRWDHNYISNINLSEIPGDPFEEGWLFHTTMTCGNDNLIGDPVPEPGTFALLGLGLLGMAFWRRKKA